MDHIEERISTHESEEMYEVFRGNRHHTTLEAWIPRRVNHDRTVDDGPIGSLEIDPFGRRQTRIRTHEPDHIYANVREKRHHTQLELKLRLPRPQRADRDREEYYGPFENRYVPQSILRFTGGHRTEDDGSFDSLTTPCDIHQEKYIEYYCRDHNMALCGVCVNLNHPKRYCQVNYIPHISGEILNSDMYHEIIARAQSIEKKCDCVKTRTQDRIETSQSLSRTLSELQKYKRDIIRKLDEYEEKLTKSIGNLNKQNEDKIKSDETVCKVTKKRVEEKRDTLIRMNKSKQSNQLLIELLKASNILDESNDDLSSVKTKQNKRTYEFTPNKSILRALETKGGGLGKISSYAK